MPPGQELGKLLKTRAATIVMVIAVAAVLAIPAAVLAIPLFIGNAPGDSTIDHEQELDPRYFVLAHTQSDHTSESATEIDRRQVRVRKGDTLMKLLHRNRVPRPDAAKAIAALRKVTDPRKLQIGQTINLHFTQDPKQIGPKQNARDIFIGLAYEPTPDHIVNVGRSWDGSFKAARHDKALTRVAVRKGAAIGTSLYLNALRAGVPAAVVVEMIHIFSFDVDFQRDIQRHDSFEVMYSQFNDAAGNPIRLGNVIYASLTLSGEKLSLYRHQPKKGVIDYFNEKGESMRKSLMRTPIDGARLTSRFGRRRHPILGYNRVHRGLDFGAPRGTPIMAAGSGRIVSAGWNGAYGRYIRIRHNSTYKTAYAHLSRFARGIRRGRRVKQGQIIGYVGSTGRSTGPHLHYEVLVSNRRVNPLKLRLPTGRKLKGQELSQFRTVRDRIVEHFAELATDRNIADR